MMEMRFTAVLLATASMATCVAAFSAPVPVSHRVALRSTHAMRPESRLGRWRMQDDGGKNEKWTSTVDENKEKLESVKAAVLSAVAGSIAFGPVSLVLSESFYPADAWTSQWELAHDGLAVMLALFGLVYRYAVRQDPNPQLKQGVVGAFVITRAWSMLQADPACSPVPLQCGPPLGYFNWHMLMQGGGAAAESILAFAAAAVALEVAFSKGWVGRFPSA